MATVTSKVSVKWIESTLMAGIDSRGRNVLIGSHEGQGVEWVGMKPSDLLLIAAASCSTYDVATILAKQREPLEKLDVICSGEQEAEPPHKFIRIHLHYIVLGAVEPKKLEKAIQLSEDKYCSVIASLRPNIIITSDYELVKNAQSV